MGLVIGVVASAVGDSAVCDVFVLSDAVSLGDDDSPAAVVTVSDVVDVKSTVELGTSTGTDEFPHATVPNTMEVAMDTNATRRSRLPVEIAPFMIVTHPVFRLSCLSPILQPRPAADKKDVVLSAELLTAPGVHIEDGEDTPDARLAEPPS